MEYVSALPEWNKKKILIVRLDKLGDLIVSTPTMQRIKKTYPDSQVDLLGSTMNCALFKYCKFLDNTYIYNKKSFISIIKLIFALRQEKYDVVINLVPHSRSANLIVRLLNAPIKLAVFEPDKKFQKIYTHSSIRSKEFHILKFYQENMQHMGFEPPLLAPIIDVPQEVKNKINEALPKKVDKMRIIISLGNLKRPHNRWDIKKYAEVVKFLYEESEYKDKLDMYIMIGKADLPLLEYFKDIPKNYYTLYIGTDIAESAALIDKSDLFICTSSGPSHIATSTSCPILSIITPYMYNGWRPLPDYNRYIVNENLHEIGVEEVIENINYYIEQWTNNKT